MVVRRKSFNNGTTVLPADNVSALSAINNNTLTPDIDNEPCIIAHSLSLDGAIGVDFYLRSGVESPSLYTVDLSYAGVYGAEESTVTLTPAVYDDEKGAYRVQCFVNSPEMTREVILRSAPT